MEENAQHRSNIRLAGAEPRIQLLLRLHRVKNHRHSVVNAMQQCIRKLLDNYTSIAVLRFEVFKLLIAKTGLPLAGLVDTRGFLEIACFRAASLQLFETLAHAVQRGDLENRRDTADPAAQLAVAIDGH